VSHKISLITLTQYISDRVENYTVFHKRRLFLSFIIHLNDDQFT